MEISSGRRGSKRKQSAVGYKFKKQNGKRARTRSQYKQIAVATEELKFHDLDIDDTLVAAGGTIAEDSVLTIVQGDGESQRLGRKCVVKKIGWRYNLFLPAFAGTSLTSGDIVRVILYWDQQCNGEAATVSAAVDGDGILATSDYQSFNNLANSGRYRILMDRTHDVNITAGAGNGTANDSPVTEFNFSFFKSCIVPIEYDSTASTGAIATMRSNNIGVLLLSKNGTAGFNSKMRVRFVG